MTSTTLSLLSADAVARYTKAGYWRDETIYAVARRHAERSPNAHAVRDRHRRLTYAQLVDTADSLANDLARRGVRQQQRVLVWLPSRVEAVVALLACSRNGFAVCLSPHRTHTVAEVASFAQRMRAAALLYEPGFGADSDRNDIAEAARNLPSMRHICRLAPLASDIDDSGANALPDIPNATGGAASPQSRDPNRVIYIMFTSGSTGQPKGVMHSDNTLLCTARAIVRDWQFEASTVVYALSPHSHSLGVGAILTTLVAGGELVMHDLASGASLIDRLIETGATYLVGVPTHAIDLLDEMRRRGMTASIGKVRGFRISAAAAPAPVVAEMLQRGVLPQRGYGMTEVNSHQYTLPDDDHRLIVETSGKSCPEHELRIWRLDDPDTEAAVGEVGEIGSRGASLMLGYFDDQIATESAFNAHGWFMTGDLGWVDENGYLRVTGRKKDVIIRGGHNINPARIEDLAMQHAAVERAAAIPVADPRLGERICLAVTLRPGHTASQEHILGHLAQAGLSKYEMPEFFVAVADMPLMPNGKIQRQDLTKLVQEGRVVPRPVGTQT
ncbi:MAG: AMP-binding protein [Rhizobiales bacterium]|nr:AMP-binding protein [Hyphomicrobiales bacterium]